MGKSNSLYHTFPPQAALRSSLPSHMLHMQPPLGATGLQVAHVREWCTIHTAVQDKDMSHSPQLPSSSSIRHRVLLMLPPKEFLNPSTPISSSTPTNPFHLTSPHPLQTAVVTSSPKCTRDHVTSLLKPCQWHCHCS